MNGISFVYISPSTLFNHYDIISDEYYQFKEDLVEKLDKSLEEIDEQEMKEFVEKLKSKIEKCSLDELKKAENFFE